ncbi:MAG: hypothetical protein ACXWLM_12250 [Myxococcales bacterium]
MLLALLIAAAPWLEMSGGPVLVVGGSAAGSRGTMARFDVGVPLAESLAAEVWAAGMIEDDPHPDTYAVQQIQYSSALFSLGAGGRYRVLQLGSSIALWAHAGAGWAPYIGTSGRAGPMGFGGAIVAFQPFLKRFSLGVEAQASLWVNTLGPDNAVALSLLPYLRCSF